MFTNLLVFMLVLNIFGAIVFPYIIGKQGALDGVFLPLSVIHKYAITIEFFILLIVAPSYSPYFLALAVVGSMAIFDLFTGLKYAIINGGKYIAPPNEIAHDFRVFINHHYSMDNKFRPYVIQVNDSRIMADLINLFLIIMILA